MKYSYLLILLALTVYSALGLPQPVYTIHYVRSYRADQIQQNFGCGKSVAYGTYLHPMGPIDALYALMNPHIYGFSANCQRERTFVKIFGDAQDYTLLTDVNIVDQIGSVLSRIFVRNVIVEWKYLPEPSQRESGMKSLESTINSLKNRGFNVTVKAPASYFCLLVGGKKYILDQPATDFIAELYGEEAGKYTTYESIFDTKANEQTQQGYTTECPKYPTKPMLQTLAAGRKVYIQKTLDSSQPGYVGSNLQRYLQKSGSNDLYFLDGYPKQTVDF